MLNLPEELFSVRIRSLDPGDHKLSHKLLANIGVDSFAGVNPQDLPSVAGITYYHPFAID